MNAEQWNRLDDIFLEALALRPEARAAYCDRVCGGDREMRAELDRWLRGNERAERLSFLNHAAWRPHAANPDGEQMIGKIIEGKYEILKPIGEPSGMGDVFLAAERLEGRVAREVVIKFARENLGGDDLKRFRDEMLSLAKLSHQNIARIFNWGVFAERPYFVMEFLDGLPLNQYAARRRSEGTLTLALVNEIARQACAGLDYAHGKGLVHRDIKPQNLMILDADGAPVVKVIDFGIAKSADGFTRRATPGAIGTPFYMAPEQLSPTSFGPVGPRADVYAMGLVVHELLTGRLAVSGADVGEVIQKQLNEMPPPPGAAPAIDEVVMRAIAKSQDDRQPNPREFARQLDAAITAHLATPGEKQPMPDPAPPSRKSWWAGGAAAAALAAALGVYQFQNPEAASTGAPPAPSASAAVSPPPTIAPPVEAPASNLTFQVLDRKGAPIAPGTVFRSGQAIRLSVAAPLDGFYYLIEHGSRDEWLLLSPKNGAAPRSVRRGDAVAFPENPSNAFKFDAATGRETIVAFFTRDNRGPLVEIIRESVRRNKLNDPLQKTLLLKDTVESLLAEAAKAADGSTAVARIELNHAK